MHGMIVVELKRYVDTKLGPAAWSALLSTAGSTRTLFLPVQEYPDAEVVALVQAAASTTGLSVNAILEDFGAFLVPGLVKLYGALIREQWRTLDLIENTEKVMHRVVRMKNPGAKPPELQVKRRTPSEVVIEYASARKMCALARGICRGIAAHYRETIAIEETSCMNDGAASCAIVVRV
jgi:predicted hydrocarbon binding protein